MTTSAKSKASSTPVPEVLFGPKPIPGERLLPRYTKQVRILHWVTAITWTTLFITGMFLFVPVFGRAAQGGISTLFHHIAAIVVVGWAAVFFVLNLKGSIEGIKFAFKWGMADIKWAMAAVPYYFFGKEDKMPPQEHMNTGQKLWWLIVLGAGALMVITGALMMFFKGVIPQGAFMWAAAFHALGMVALFAMALVHVYLSVFHPKMRGIFWSMVNGMVSAHYAEGHHKKWYDEMMHHEKEAKGKDK
ncbi:MAG: cytochrome b/b6 domain-containing protein [Dehalococcoidia bacterium]